MFNERIKAMPTLIQPPKHKVRFSSLFLGTVSVVSRDPPQGCIITLPFNVFLALRVIIYSINLLGKNDFKMGEGGGEKVFFEKIYTPASLQRLFARFTTVPLKSLLK